MILRFITVAAILGVLIYTAGVSRMAAGAAALVVLGGYIYSALYKKEARERSDRPGKPKQSDDAVTVTFIGISSEALEDKRVVLDVRDTMITGGIILPADAPIVEKTGRIVRPQAKTLKSTHKPSTLKQKRKYPVGKRKRKPNRPAGVRPRLRQWKKGLR